ncbi:MAG: hypothetical protein ACLGIO_00355 [Acidimicrobiia bacterium]
MTATDLARTTLAYLAARLRIGERREDGLTTTEIAVLSFLLVGGAILVAGIIVVAAKGNAERIPEATIPAT